MMKRKGLILYASHTGNTEKIALSFKKVFEDLAWSCDCVKVVENMTPVKPDDYDIVCLGSPIIGAKPVNEIIRVWMHGGRFPEENPGGGGPPSFSLSWRQDPAKYKKAIAFVTYTGSRRGPAEALPALSLLETNLEDRGYRCIGKLACPGKIQRRSEQKSLDDMREWHWDQQTRPHARDLQKAEIFLAEILEDYFMPDEAAPDSQYICIA